LVERVANFARRRFVHRAFEQPRSFFLLKRSWSALTLVHCGNFPGHSQ
jgi:hypothetical protein